MASVRVDRFELGDELSDLRIVDGSDKPGDVDLRKVMGHAGLQDASSARKVTRKIAPTGILTLAQQSM